MLALMQEGSTWGDPRPRGIASPLQIASRSSLWLATISDYRKHPTEVQCAVPDRSGMADATQRILRCEAQRGFSLRKLCGSIYPNENSATRTESESVDMSRIWDRLQDIERHQNMRNFTEGVQNNFVPIPDRRSSERFWAYEPLLVYGHAAADDPFHEGTEALHVNARGGLITLSTAVNPGQTLLLINKVNLKEQKCNVVREKSTYLNRTAIIVEFAQPVPDFWGTPRD
jgi:hypothetical protein